MKSNNIIKHLRIMQFLLTLRPRLNLILIFFLSTLLASCGDSLPRNDATGQLATNFCALNATQNDFCEDFEQSTGNGIITGDVWKLSPPGSAESFEINLEAQQFAFEYEDEKYAAFSGKLKNRDFQVSSLKLEIYFTEPGELSYDIKHFYCIGNNASAFVTMDGVNVEKNKTAYAETADRETIVVERPGRHSFTFAFRSPDIPNCQGDFNGIIIDNIIATNAIAASTTATDTDGDGIQNLVDNCPDITNYLQVDTDGDSIGDACPVIQDSDNDGIADAIDNCPEISNPSQINSDNDRVGDACTEVIVNDLDNDGLVDDIDNCPNHYNPLQVDSNTDQIGDACTQDPRFIAWYTFDAKDSAGKDVSGGEQHLSFDNTVFVSVNGVSQKALILSENGTLGVNLPQGIVSDLDDFTISTFVQLHKLDTWSRIFDFGSGTSKYMFLTPLSGITGVLTFAISEQGNPGEQTITGTASLKQMQSNGDWTHVAVTKSGNVGKLYVNGEEVGVNNNMTLSPSDLGITTQNWLGRSQYPADPYLSGKIDDFRIYDKALSKKGIRNIIGPDPEKITLMGTDVQLSPNELKAELSASGYTFVNKTRLLANECTIFYANADSEDISAEAGVLTCSTELANGDIKMSVQAIYGGCDVARLDQGIGSKCSVGVASADLEIKLSDDPELYNELSVSGPSAEECTAISTENTCFGAGADIASASYGFKNKNGTGVGVGVSVGVGAGFNHQFNDGVVSGSIDLKLGIGVSIEYSVSGKDVLEVIHLTESAFIESEDEIIAVGNKSLEVFAAVGNEVYEVGDELVGNLEVSGEAVLVVFNDTGASVEESYLDARNAVESVSNDIKNGTVDTANTVYEGTISGSEKVVTFVGEGASKIEECLNSFFAC